ncbi:diphosphomevalonate decarboxylase [Candidatus Dojkabacteria bacterium]|nr:diphosphomevalonate decarboxylase [Candidatus Dojkabacteria bacterium]
MKSTAIAGSNIAFTKYWGRKDEKLRLPSNGSISMTLDNLLTTTTVEFSDKYDSDDIIIDGQKIDKEAKRVSKHLDRIRKRARIKLFAKVVSENNFPTSTGLSSSASGFAALTKAATAASNLNIENKELTILSRQGSGSSSRSILGGFCEWVDGDTSESSYVKQLFPKNHWELIDIIAVVSKDKKLVPTSIGHTYAQTSPFFETRLKYMKQKNQLCKKIIKEKNFQKLGEFIELEAMELHCIMLSSTPQLIYWTPESLKIMKLIKQWRKQENIKAYFTVNTGQDVHILCEPDTVQKINNKLESVPEVKDIRINRPGNGAYLTDNHLF